MRSFGEILRELRTEKKLSQAELACSIGVVPSAVGMYERNQRQPDFDILRKISSFFDASIDYLLGYTNQRGYDSQRSQEDWANIRDKIMQYRISHNLSAADMARMARISVNIYKYIESGKFFGEEEMRDLSILENVFLNENNLEISSEYQRLALVAQECNLTHEDLELIVNLIKSLNKK